MKKYITYFFCRDLADLLDGHPFFSALKTDADFWNALATAFPDQDIPIQINRMTAWLIANPNKRYRNYKRFIQGWLSRAARKENDHGKNRDDSAESPLPFPISPRNSSPEPEAAATGKPEKECPDCGAP